MNNKDPFAHRTQGGMFTIGTDEDSGTRGFIEVDGDMLILTDKNIYKHKLPDSIDPNRKNPNIPVSQQKIVSYGSEDSIVGRTLQQANVLFKQHSLADHVDTEKAISLAMLFLKEIVSLTEQEKEYKKIERELSESFTGKLKEDSSLHIPTINDVEQRLKKFVGCVNQSHKYIMGMAQLFYTDIPKEQWNIKLKEKIVKEFNEEHPCVLFLKSIEHWIWLMRELRNEVEHSLISDALTITNYELKETGRVHPPTITFNHKKVPLSTQKVSDFMSGSIENSLLCFELLMAHLCNIHAQSFTGDERTVIEVPADKRESDMPFVRFAYHVSYTK
jgi:hypothetical protein